MSLNRWPKREKNLSGQTKIRSVLSLSSSLSHEGSPPSERNCRYHRALCSARAHTHDIPRHIPDPLWIKVISNSISFFLQTHIHTGSDPPLAPRPGPLPMKTNKLSHSNLRNMTSICVWVCVSGRRCKGKDFLLMVLQEGGMEEMQKRRRRGKSSCREWGKFEGAKPTDGVCRIC